MVFVFDWFKISSSLIIFVNISFGDNKSFKICPKTLPKISASSCVEFLILPNKMSIFSVYCITNSGSSCTIPFDFSVFSSCSKDPMYMHVTKSFNPPMAKFLFSFLIKSTESFSIFSLKRRFCVSTMMRRSRPCKV